MKLINRLKARLGLAKDSEASNSGGTDEAASSPKISSTAASLDSAFPASKPSPRSDAEPNEPTPAALTPRSSQKPMNENESVDDVDLMVKEFQAIQELLHSEDDSLLDIPCKAVLRSLPEEYRGPNWSPDQFPETTLQFDRNEVVEQLISGKVTFPFQTFSDQLPDGYIDAPEDAVISLDLALVVDALPSELLAVEAQPSEDMQAVANMRDFFKPNAPAEEATTSNDEEAADFAAAQEASAPQTQAEEEKTPPHQPAQPSAPAVEGAEFQPVPEPQTEPTPQPEPAPEPAPAEHPKPEDDHVETPRKPAPIAASAPKPTPAAESEREASAEIKAWSGREPSLESAPYGIDINDASLEELIALPGMGPVSAQCVLDYRNEHGPFSSIYELAQVPRIGPKTFGRVTGLSLRSHKRRQEKLNRLLGFSPEAVPSIPKLVAGIAATLKGSGALISNAEGICVAAYGTFPVANELAGALAPRLMERSRGYLKRLANNDGDCLIVPLEGHSLVLLARHKTCVVVSFDQQTPPARAIAKARSVAEEVSWLLAPRAIVQEQQS